MGTLKDRPEIISGQEILVAFCGKWFWFHQSCRSGDPFCILSQTYHYVYMFMMEVVTSVS